MADTRKPQSLITTFLRATLIIALVASGLIGYFWIIFEYERFHEETAKLKQDYLAGQRAQLKQEIDKAVGYIYSQRSKTEARLKSTIESRTNEAYAIALNIYEANRAAKPLSEIQTMVKEALRPIRFNNGRGYYFAAAMDGREALFADHPEMEGKLMLDLKDAHGRLVIRDMIALARKTGQGFLQYHWTKPGQAGQDFPKIAFIRYFAPFDWFIGTGEYLDDVERDIQAEVFEQLSQMQLDKNTYLFAYTYEGMPLFSEGQDNRGAPSIRSWKDPNGVAVFQEQLKLAGGDAGGFVNYTVPSPEANGTSRLISYVRGIAEWRWVIGGSISLDPIVDIIHQQETVLGKQVRGHIMRILIILAAMVAIIYALALFIAYKTHIGLDLFAQFFEKASSESAKIPLADMYFSEFQRIAESANAMLDTISHANEELKLSESRFRAMIEKGQEIIMVIDADGVIRYETPSIQAALGYPAAEMLGKTAWDFIPPENRAILKDLLEEIRPAEGLSRTAKLELQHADGSMRIFDCSVTNHLSDPAINAFVINGRDITERQHIMDAVAESEEKYRRLFELGSDAIFLIDSDSGEILDANATAVALYGYSHAELLRLRNVDVSVEPDKTRQAALEQYTDIPLRFHRKKDGTVFAVEITASHYLWQGRSVHIAAIRDISARLKAEERLRLMEFSIEHSDEAVYWLDPQARFLYVNQGCVKMWGYSRAELLTMRIHDLDPDLDPELWPLQWEDSRTRVSFTLDARHVTKKGTIIPVEIRVNFREFGGKAYNFAIAHDTSEHRNLEERLQRAQKMEALGLLAGGVAHDLNNILSGIMSYPDLLLMQTQPGSPLEKPLQTIKKSGEKAAAIVQDLLTLARRGVASTEVVNLNNIIEEYLVTPEHARMMGFHHRVRLEKRLETELLPIMGSPLHLSKTIMNLISNAAEAMVDDGTITIATRNQYLDRPLKAYEDLRAGDYVVLTVTDTGEGISHEDLERIFEPFYTKKVMGRSGTGLGLAVVWGTLKDHQGYIDIETEAGRGTTFSLYFPATREAPAVQKTTVSLADFQGRGESILVVDDVPEQRELATHMLLKLGYIVTSVAGGLEAVTYLETHHVDLVLLDMIMDPGIDGLETYQRILALHPRQKAVIVSGYAETERVRQAQHLGAGPYVKKPYLIEKLGMAIRAELDHEVPYAAE